MPGNSEKQPLLNTRQSYSPKDTYVEVTAKFERSSDSVCYQQSSFKFNYAQEKVERLTISWRNINVWVPEKKGGWFGRKQEQTGPLRILRNVNGVAKAGTLLAILGASGAGKSTLMNVLTGRNQGKLIHEGEVLVNGHSIGDAIKNISAYVQQDDLFVGQLTVKEHLVFRATLRMDKDLSQTERLKKVDEVIHELGLSKCQDTKIGVPGRIKGISGGEMKRLSFATELLTNPPLLFCDEPTSGLDSYMAQNIIQTLRTMSGKGRTILCTIHQPSSEVYAMFDQILYLAEGRVAYMGSAEDVFPFFGSIGFNCPNNFNPADYFVRTLAIISGQETKCSEKIEGICDAFDLSKEAELIQSTTEEVIANSGENIAQSISEDIVSSRRYEVSWFVQFYILFWRSWVFNIREPQVLRVRGMQSMVMAIIFGLVYLQVEINQAGIQNINGIIFLLLMSLSMTNMFSVVHNGHWFAFSFLITTAVFPLEMPLLFREYGSGLYRIDVYYISKILSEFPLYVTFALLFTIIVYWMVGLNSDASIFLICCGMAILIASVAISFGYLLSTLASSVAMATAIAPPLIMPLIIFGGLFLNNASVPVYFVWLQYISWFKYANEILVINQWSSIKNITCETFVNGTGLPSRPCFTTGKQVIQSLNFNEDNFYLDFGLLFVLMTVFSVLSFVFLLIKAKRSRQ